MISIYLSIFLSLDLSSRGAAPQVGRGVAVGLLPTPATPGRGGRKFSLRMNLPQNHGGWIGMNTQWWLGWIELSYVFFSLLLLGYFYVMNWDVIVGFLGLIGMCIYWDLLERILNDDWDILGVNWDQIPFPLHIFRKKPRNNGGSIEHEITHWDHTMKLFNIFQCWGDGNINKLEQK